jgi:hypothetical protein
VKPSLSKITDYSRLEAYLNSILVAHWTAARWAARIRSPAGLPVRLQECIRYRAKDTAWCAYADAHQVYFAFGRKMQTAPPPCPSMIEAYFLDAEASLVFRGIWPFDPSEVPGNYRPVTIVAAVEPGATSGLISAPTHHP